jgi:hypothetical protein
VGVELTEVVEEYVGLLVEQVGAVKPVANDEEEALSLFTKPE